MTTEQASFTVGDMVRAERHRRKLSQRALAKRAGRHYGEDGLHLVELPQDRRRVVVWAVHGRSDDARNPRSDDGDARNPRSEEEDDDLKHAENDPKETRETRGAHGNPRSENSVTCTDDDERGFRGFSGPVSREEKLSTEKNSTDRVRQTRETRAPADDSELF